MVAGEKLGRWSGGKGVATGVGAVCGRGGDVGAGDAFVMRGVAGGLRRVRFGVEGSDRDEVTECTGGNPGSL